MFFLRSGKKREQQSDLELVAEFRETGDTSLVGVLYERYAAQIYGICRKYLKDTDESKDASMEVFEYLLKELKKYEIRNFPSWLGQATRNFVLMRMRKSASIAEKSEEYKKSEAGFVEPEDFSHPTEEVTRETELQALEKALESLAAEQRECVKLFYLQGKSYREICEATGYSELQVKSYIQNGKRNLRIKLSG